MIDKLKASIVLCLIICVISGCASGIPYTLAPDYGKRGIRLIALAPVTNKSGDEQAARLLRERVLDALYFKGYPRIPLGMIDEKVAEHTGRDTDASKDSIPPEVMGKLLDVDAVMYCRLLERKTSFVGMYAPTTVSVEIELKDIGGATLWSSRHGIVDRHYDFTRERLELKAYQAYEPAIREIIDKTFSSLPDGPDFVGKPPAEKSCWKFW